MMELGNDAINNIYEANYKENDNTLGNDGINSESSLTQIRRATSDCDNNDRMAWIKAKYIDKLYVIPTTEIRPPEGESQQNDTLKDIILRENGWLVRQKQRKRFKIQTEKSEKRSTDDSASGSEISMESNRTNDDLSFGSDNDSTDEDEDMAYGIIEEKFEDLNSDMILYRATIVHNSSVMCYALASGATKNWSNPKDSMRSAIHQAVLSVSVL